MTALTRRGGTGGCCGDCQDVHNGDERKPCGCMGCLPQWLCVVIKITPPEDPEDIGCCRYLHARTPLRCGTDGYDSVSLSCNIISLTVSFQVVDGVDGCCFVVTVTSSEEEVVYSMCTDPYTGLPGAIGLDEDLDILITAYPEYRLTGTITVSPLTGVSNSGQYTKDVVDPYTGEITSECPACDFIKLNPRKEPVPDPPIQPCDRQELPISSKIATRLFGSDWQQQIDDGNLFSNELCWVVAPCKCIPDRVCVDYVYYDTCSPFGTTLKRSELLLTDCVYGPESFTVTRGSYGTDTVTITGTLNSECEIVWSVDTDYGGGDFVKALTRIDLDPDLSKRCDVSLVESSVPGTGLDGNADDTITVAERCLCLQNDDEDCPHSCYDIRRPPNANPDCHLVVLTATVISGGCDFEGFSFPMHYETYEVPQSVTQDYIPPETSAVCQLYFGYNLDTLGFYIVFPDCATLGTTGDSAGDYLSAVGRFTLFYPTLCDTRASDEVQETNPELYRLTFDIDATCNFAQASSLGTLSPISASCDPFELIFEVPFPDITDCTCSCSTFQLKITL